MPSPDGARSALDVGCGNGLLTAELHTRVPDVTGVDSGAGVLDGPRQLSDTITWARGDVMTYEFDRQFDVAASIATLHHLPDLDEALHRLAELTAPGGVLAVIGIARASRPKDTLIHAVGALQHQWMARRHRYWEHTAPTVWPPPHDYATVLRTAKRVLPAAQWKQLPLFRYALTWRKPR